ncbi:MAG: O-antigen ligase family protein, partial [Methylococcales bacterium]
ICAWCAIQSGGKRPNHRYFELIALFVAAILLSITASPDSTRSVQFCLVLLPSLMVFYLLSEEMDLEQIAWVSNCMVAVGLVLGGLLLWIAWRSVATSPAVWINEANITFLHVPNDVAMLMILSPFSLAAFVQNPAGIMRVPGIISVAVNVAVAVIYQSRLSVILLALALGIVWSFRVGRKKFLAGGLVFFTLLLTVDLLGGGSLLAKFASTWGSRLPLWIISWCMFLKKPFFGNGPGSYLLGFHECLAGVTQDDWLFSKEPNIAPWAHNLYLEVLAEHGLAGFFSLIIMLAYTIVCNYRVLSKLQGWIRPLNMSILASLIAFCVAAIFELSLWRQWVTLLLATLMGLAACIQTYVTMKGKL